MQLDEVRVDPHRLDYSDSVARRILQQLSFDYNAVEVFNVQGSPTLEQLKEIWLRLKPELGFTSIQCANIEKHLAEADDAN
jgi:hypothetical protein